MNQVVTKYGIVRGIPDEKRKTVLYAGIPYAAPPVGELRWRAPAAPLPWKGVLDCTGFRASSLQKVMPIPSSAFPCYGQEYFLTKNDSQSEDCLYLNIWVPADAEAGRKLPVIMILCGGGYAYGSGSIPVISGRNLAGKGVIVVTVNYRLGVLGFLAHPELSKESAEGVSGNYGILDQIAALGWIRENIADFGGDSDNITLAGESAGAFSVSVLCCSQLSGGMFHKAVAQSGTRISVSTKGEVSLAEAETFGVELAKKFDASSIKELRERPAVDFIGIRGPMRYVLDGYVLPGCGEKIRILQDIPVLIGSNSDEGKTFYRSEINREILEKELKERYGTHYALIKKIYPDGYSDIAEAGYAEYRDSRAEFPMLSWATIHTENCKAPAYLYYFDRAVPGQDFGAFHSANLQYFYGNLDCNEKIPWEQTDYVLSEAMMNYLVNFMYTGNPNGTGLPEWRKFEAARAEIMELGDHLGMIEHPHREAMEALETVFG